MSITLDGTNGITTPDLESTGPVTGTTGTFSGDVSGANLSGKNRIINGDMRIDQRNAGASVAPFNSYTVDRWWTLNSLSGKLTAQQNAAAVTPPAGFVNYLGITSTSAYSVLAGDYFALLQSIEGSNVSDLDWGKASAAAITISFRVRSSLIGTFGGTLQNNGQTRSYPFSYSIPVANTWTTITLTVPGDTAGTWLTDNGAGIYVMFALGAGSTYSGTAGAWAAGNVFSATGAVSVVGTNGATFYITGVQLEKGSTATSFDYRDYGRELIMCQRYYEVITMGSADTLMYANTSQANTLSCTQKFAVEKRATPSSTFTTPTYSNCSSLVVVADSSSFARHRVNTAAAGTYGANNYSTMYSAEL